MKTAIGYIRVSTEALANEGVSLDTQRAKIAAWCVANADEQRSLELIRALHGKGYSLQDIAAELERRCVLTKAGKTTWSPKVVRGLLLRNAA